MSYTAVCGCRKTSTEPASLAVEYCESDLRAAVKQQTLPSLLLKQSLNKPPHDTGWHFQEIILYFP